MTGGESCHETVDPETRDQALKQAQHTCRGCGRQGPGAGGLATLHIHHVTRDPVEMDEHDLDNLTVFCRRCHSWHHHQTTADDVAVDLTEADKSELLPHDVEILRVLAEQGPATTGDITGALSADLTAVTVRERLWVLMGLDNTVASRDQQVVDQDAATGEWGLVGQVSNSSRGRIPDDPQTLLQRAEDERVRQALDRGCDREAVADVIGVVSRTTWHKEKRARAYEFPLDALDDKGGRPPAGTEDEGSGSDGVSAQGDSSVSEDFEQHRLDTPSENVSRAGQLVSDPEHTGPESSETADSANTTGVGDVKTQLREAIDALEALDTVL